VVDALAQQLTGSGCTIARGSALAGGCVALLVAHALRSNQRAGHLAGTPDLGIQVIGLPLSQAF
jgi:hypothetical protein